MEDHQIIELYFARDEAAIRYTAERYGAYCKTVAMGVLDSEPDADECVNDTYLRVWNAIPPARPPVLRAFLAKITRNLAIDRYRFLHSARRNRELEVALDELSLCSPAEEHSDGLSEALGAFLGTLDEIDRNLFVGRYWYIYPVKTLAKGYDMEPNVVSLRLHRTREKLRKYLIERGYRI